jgi:hypothetical protein
MKINIEFDDFEKTNVSGKFIVNPFWLEYLLNLFHQGYMGEIWEEIIETQINNNEMIESLGYGTIGKTIKEFKHG